MSSQTPEPLNRRIARRIAKQLDVMLRLNTSAVT